MPPHFPPRPKNGPSPALYHCRRCGKMLRRAEIVRVNGEIFCSEHAGGE